MTACVLAVFARALGFFVRAPGFSRLNVPASVRVLFAFVLAIAVAPSAGRLRDPSAIGLLAIVASEAFAGAAFGFGATLIFEAFAAAGRMLDDLVGLRASVPGIGVAPVGFGGLWLLVFIAAYFALGGIDALIVAFAKTFSVVPVGAAIDVHALHAIGFEYAPRLARMCLEFAAPAICVTLCIHLGLAVLARVVPRFGHLSLTYPAAYAGAMLIAFVSLTSVRDAVLYR
jgi:flagellar biosynthetic protein FliR